ncbi:MAG TPA: histidinol-phosphate transaminase [Acidimicrobiales bacterium]|nr:histidinol-phosphate transaminase [Acidimicrobiales bacterium]
MTIPEPRPDLALREGYHSAQVDVPVRLNTNESPLPPPPEWTERLAEEVRAVRFNRYPDRDALGLREALAGFHGVDAGQVFCANGSNEVLQSICLAYGGAGRSAAVFEPTYALHAHIAHLTGTAVVEGGRRDDFTLDPHQVADLLGAHRPAITFLCSPNNPTGLAEDRATVAAIVEGAPGLVVVDEAYGQFSDWSALDLVEEGRPLVVVRTFSKTWSMAAARLGYAVAPAPLVEALRRVALPYHLDSVKQAAGRLALEYAGEMEQRVAQVVRERERISAAMAAMAITVWPSQANFVLFRPERRKAAEVWEGLVERGVLVRDTSGWPGLAGCLRVTVGTPGENDAFLAALGELV